MNRYFTLLPLLLWGSNIAAQTEKVLNPVVVTGTGTYHKADYSPVAVRVITQQELQEAAVTSLQDALLKLTPNITTHTTGMGTFMNFNGLPDGYIVILENGKRVSGDDRWNRISLDNIKRIEIMPSAASVLYGSDAIAGVINIITDDTASRESSVHATSRSKLQGKGRYSQDINVDVTKGRFSSFTSYNHRQADNWQVNNLEAFQEGDTQVLKLTGRPMSQGFRSDNVSEKLAWKFNDQWDVYAKANVYDYNTRRDRNAQYFTQKTATDKTTGEKSYTYTAKQAYTYDLHHLSYNAGAGARWSPRNDIHVYLDAYTDNYRSDYDYWQTTLKEAYSETRKNTRYWNETLRGIFRLGSWNKLSAGMELEQHILKSDADNIDRESTATYSLFAQDEMSIVRGLEAVAALRYTYNENFGSHLTPNVALFYHIGGFRARMSYAGGYRTPTLSQMYATDQAKTTSRYTVSNKALKPEKNNFLNLNLEYTHKWFSASVNGFLNKVRDMIDYRTLTQADIDADSHLKSIQDEGWKTIRQRSNIANVTIKGVSANLKVMLPCDLTIGAGYTFTDCEPLVDKSVRHVANITASWQHQWTFQSGTTYLFNVNTNGHLQSQRYSSTYGYAPKYQLWDLNTRHTFTLRRSTSTPFVIEPGLGIENVFNKRDNSYWNSNFSTITPGRSLYVSLRLAY